MNCGDLMNCNDAAGQIPFYVYGEVSSAVEESLEAHLEGCEACRVELGRQRSFLELLDTRDPVSDAGLLAQCRADLREKLRPRPALKWFEWFEIRLRIPVGAMALLAMGWFGARYTQEPARPMFSSIQSVEPDGAGHIRIAVDDVRRHVVTGSLQDAGIRQLLLSAVKEQENPGIRAESIGVLNGSGVLKGADSGEVRAALLEAVAHDPDSRVRLKALDGLKPYSGDALVRRALANVLLRDEDAGIRVQAIDTLTKNPDAGIAGVLQDAVQKEENSYIRARCQHLLEAMKASVGTY